MNRRDTIIVAVLINAGLLTILFATAMNTHEEPFLDRNEMMRPPAEKLISAVEPEHVPEPVQVPKPVVVQSRPEPVQEAPTPVVAIRPPSTPSPVPSTTNEEFVTVKVKRGDYLEKIARNNSTTVRAIMDANDLATTRVNVGQELRIPLEKAASAPSRVPTPSQPSGADFYVVQSGDNPWVISRRTGVAFDELLRLNSLNEEKARNLRPGDRLRIR